MQQIAKWSKGIRHQVIPHNYGDLLYKIMVSALAIGETKFQNDTKNGGHKAKCPHHECNHNPAQRQSQSIKHVFMDCPPVKKANKILADQWSSCTGENLDTNNERLMLFGDRESSIKLPSEILEEPFRLIHAAHINSIWRHERDLTKNKKTYTAQDILNSTYKAVDKELQHLYKTRKSQGKLALFETTWLITNLVSFKNGKPTLTFKTNKNRKPQIIKLEVSGGV